MHGEELELLVIFSLYQAQDIVHHVPLEFEKEGVHVIHLSLDDAYPVVDFVLVDLFLDMGDQSVDELSHSLHHSVEDEKQL